MKILVLSPKYPPNIGGTEIYVKSLTEWLSKLGYDVTICMLGQEDISLIKERENLIVYKMSGILQKIPILFKNTSRTSPLPISDQIFIKKIINLINNQKPDIIHANGWMLYSAIYLKKKLNIPLIATIHDYGFICPKKTLMNGNMICNKCFTDVCVHCGIEQFGLTASLLRYLGVISQKNKLKYVDRFIAVSPFVKEVHSKYIDENRITVIPNFYDANEKHAITNKESNTLPNDFILFVGSLTLHKGADILINAFNMIKDGNIKLVMCGKKYFKNLFKINEDILIFEDAPRNLVLEAYSRCRFVVIPSAWPETFGIVAIEAMSYKKAIIASATGGLISIVENGSTGILIPPNNPRELAAAMDFLIRNSDIALSMGAAGYDKFMSNYTPEVVLPKIQAIYASIKDS